jgi:hypothetical protein
MSRPPSEPPPTGRRLLMGVFPLVLLATVLGAIGLARSNPRVLFVTLLLLAGALPLGWLMVSTLWPAKADRTCPACGATALERLDAASTHGLSCRACGWSDETASGWLLAEEEGPMEPLVLGRRTATRSGPGSAPTEAPRERVDSPARPS